MFNVDQLDFVPVLDYDQIKEGMVLYWQTLNRTMFGFDKKISDLWREEKRASVESVNISREESLQFLASERERIMKMSKDQTISEILKSSKIDGKIRAVQSVCDNGLFGMV